MRGGHTSWNFLLKRSDHKTAFLGSLGAVSFAASIDGIGTRGLMFSAVSVLLPDWQSQPEPIRSAVAADSGHC